jgi:glycosyltransferase involved in cell wall biosynthesis
MASKYLFVTNDAWFFVSHRLPIAKALVQSGEEVFVCAKRDTSAYEIEAVGCTFIEWNLSPRGVSPIQEVYSVAALARIIHSVKPDILHLITIKAVLYGSLLSRILRTPHVVCAVAGLGALLTPGKTSSRSSKVLRRLYKVCLSNNRTWLIFQNPDNRRDLESALNLEIVRYREIKGSGVDLETYTVSGEAPGIPVVVLAARLLRDKGILDYLAAAEIVHRKTEKVRFILAGSDAGRGNPAAFDERELKHIQTHQSVDYVGHVHDIPKLFTDSHIVVLPSYHEGFPKVLVEAAACGKPVITTDVPGCRHAIINRQTGILVPKASPEALAKAILTLLDNRQLRVQMGLAGRALAEQEYDIRKIVSEHLSLYGNLLSNKGQ